MSRSGIRDSLARGAFPLALLLAATMSLAQGGASMHDTILRLEDSAMEEWRRGNPMRWAEISANDVIYVDPQLSAPIVGREAYVRYLEPLRGKVSYDASEYVRPKVAVYGDLAILTYNYHSLRKVAEGPTQRTSFWNTTEVYRRAKGAWKIVHTHWSYIQHARPEQLEMTVPVIDKGVTLLTGAAAEVMRLEVEGMERWRRGDPTGVLAHAAPEVTAFERDTETRLDGFGQLKLEYEKAAAGVRYDINDIVGPRFLTGTDAVVVYYQLLATSINADGTVKARQPWHCTRVYARQGGRWTMVHSHRSLIKGVRAGGGM
jgi:ketosteroid isomerase-like protein